MVIITRAEALRSRSTRYYTGVPCKFGHLSERSTRTYACVDCRGADRFSDLLEEKRREWLQPPVPPARRGRTYRRREQQLKNARESRTKRAALAEMTRRRIRLLPKNEDLMLNFILSAAQAREPSLTFADISTKFKPRRRRGGFKLHEFLIHPDDVEFIRDLLAIYQPTEIPCNSFRGKRQSLKA